VSFVAWAAEGGQLIPRFSGAWLVTARVLSLDYLWNEVRVKGGAYGCGISCTTNGRLQYYSFRDPAIDPTLARFEAAADWLANWDPSVDEFEGYIVSNVAKRDAPLKPRTLARRQDIQRFSGVTEELRTTVRNEILACTPEAVRAQAAVLRELRGSFNTCVFGGRDQIAASAAGLNMVDLLGSGSARA
jgi:Zn-dependent M16 (insulinase) family peptidase